jgi:hypothetical protein
MTAVEDQGRAEQRGSRVTPQDLFRDRHQSAHRRSERRDMRLEDRISQHRFQVIALPRNRAFYV